MKAHDPRLRNLSPDQKRRLLHAAVLNRRQAAVGGAQPEVVRSSAKGRWLVALSRRPAARRRLFCFPHGGAGATSFRHWPSLLPPDIEPFAVSLPGREDRSSEPFVTSVESAVSELAAELAPLLDRAYLFYGHSFGGTLAYATALAVCERGLRRPEALIVAAIGPPGQRSAIVPPGSPEERYLSAADDVDMRRLAENPGLRDQFLRRARADEALVEEWSTHNSGALEPPILALGGREDRWLSASAMAGWAAFTRGTFELSVLPGPHLFHLHDPAPVVERICRALGSSPLRSRLGAPAEVRRQTDGGLKLSLFFFSAVDAEDDRDKYRLFDSAVQFADRAGFDAVWIPERHFHPVGGLFPNPSVLAALVAASTSRIRIRSGSVVIPMHDPIRVAEEWATVDNLSGGRVGLGVVPGWNPNDYALAPSSYRDRWAIVFEHLETVRRLWRGEAILRLNGIGEKVLVRSHPRPLQPELPVWIATSANAQSFVRAGEIGANILTALLIQPLDAFEQRVALYRDARARAGYDRRGGVVTLMVPTLVSDTDAAARSTVRDPFLEYMRSIQSLWKDTVKTIRIDSAISQGAIEDMVFERYFHKSTLFGSMETCLDRAHEFQKAGATEIACMIDFGVPYGPTMESLAWLERMQWDLAADGSRQ
jgi:natural product biosynthesis luciferase-like monooxygenase protein